MSVQSEDQDTLLPTTTTTTQYPDSLSTASVLHWIQTSGTLPDTSYLPAPAEETPTRSVKRCRSLDSIPSDYLGNRSSFAKRHRGLKEDRGLEEDTRVEEQDTRLEEDTRLEQASDMADMGACRLPTPSIESSTDTGAGSPLKSSSTSNTNPQTPKRQKKSSDQDAIGYRMGLHGLLQNDEVFDNEATFKAHVTNIVTADRGSTMKDTSVKKFRDHLKVYGRSNETTFLHHMIPILQGDGYHIAPYPEFDETKEEQAKEEGRNWRTFLSDEKIKDSLNQDFTRTLLPSKFYEDPSLIKEMVKELAKDKDMTNPRPDYVLGLQRERYSLAIEAKIPPNILDLLDIAPGMHHVFLILEGKSHSGSSAMAENQARRGGATLVNALQLLYAELEKGPTSTAEPTSIGNAPPTGVMEKDAAPKSNSIAVRPNYRSFVFSVTMSPTIFQIWVHWFDEASRLFHMNSVESYAIQNTKGPPEIRQALHNIIEWGSVTRHTQNKALIESIIDYARRSKQKMQQDKLAGKKAAASAYPVPPAADSGPRKRPWSEGDVE